MHKTINGKKYYFKEDGAKLNGADFSHGNLEDLKLRNAVVWGADCQFANFRSASFTSADFEDTNFFGANLYGADFTNANFRNADLRMTDFSRVCAYGANFEGANLSGANLFASHLEGANLKGAIFCNTILQKCNLEHAKNIPQEVYDMTLIVPEGDIIGYKKLANSKICKLLIPAGAKRFNATSRKCRAEYAIVLEGEGRSQHCYEFKYRVGATVRPSKPFNKDRWSECSSGIHFFLTRGEAERY